MPANLPPEYFSAEQRFKEAKSTEEKIAALEDVISAIPKHKGTDKLRAEYRRKLSKLKTQPQSKKKPSRHESQFYIEKEGAARVVIVGAPNTGKSSLLASLTHAAPEVSESPYTTWTPTPGMMQLQNIQIQLIDTPPLDKEYIEPELMNLIRSADMILVTVDLHDFPIQQLEDTIEILKNNKIYPSYVTADPSAKNITSLPLLIVVNKTDNQQNDEDYKTMCELVENKWPLQPLSITNYRYFDELSKAIFEHLNIIRIYSKPPGKDARKSKPFVLKKGSTVEEFARKVHHDFVNKLKSARIWGTGVHDGQMVGRDHILYDQDIVELHL
ncbi:MAG: hypothetical protein A2V66_15225 [Ignavibacteria bacterium RBG_13_36_8]|nr:MAG: hypothetical protein A2V66_15225 [Ignavibacteria bacterium RBG_13_36_8]